MAINLVPMSTDVGGRGGQDPLVQALGRRQQASPFTQMRAAAQQPIASRAQGNLALATALLGGIGEGYEAGQQQRQKQQGAQQVGTFLRQMGLSDEEARTATALAVSNPEALTPFLRQAAEQRFRQPDRTNVNGNLVEVGRDGTPRVLFSAPREPQAQPNDVREYEFARGQGFQGSFVDYQRQMREAGRNNVTVNNQQQVERAYDVDRAKQEAARFQTFQNEAQSARSQMQTLGVMRRMLDSGVRTGSGAETEQTIRRALVAIGVTDPNVPANFETFRAQSNRVIMDGLGGSLGAQISNTDRDFIAATAPNVTNTPEGNRQLIGLMERLAQRRVQAAELAADYERRNGRLDTRFDQELAKWAEANPLFPEADPRRQQQQQQQAPGAPPAPNPAAVPAPAQQQTPQPDAVPMPPEQMFRPQSQEEMMALPPGTVFQAPDGSFRVRP